MSKFNMNATIPMTTNHEGLAAYEMSDKDKLVTQVLTSFFNEEKFYGDNSEEIKETITKVVKSDPEFVSRLCMFARNEFNMRSISHVLVSFLAFYPEGKPYVKTTVKNIIKRGDDATEILACYLSMFGKPIPNSLRKALRDIFPTFDAYTLAKYKGEGKTVKMRDILCLAHPVPTSAEQSEAWKKLLEGTLEPAYTWETELSAKGNNKETWEALIASKRLPYMATLRNLRNIITAAPDNYRDVLNYICNPEAVRKSKQLPFRYLSAYNNVPNGLIGNGAAEALEKAADISVDNLPKIPGRTVIAIDVSGSMHSPVSRNSDVRCCDIAMLLGIIANRICEESVVYMFDTSIQEFRVPQRNGILYMAKTLSRCGGGTEMSLPFKKMLADHIDCDRVIIISDEECNYDSGWSGWRGNRTVQHYADEYRRESGNNIWVHAVDLCGYGTQQFTGSKTNIIAGWSEKIFEFILLAEQGSSSLMKRISEYVPS